MAGNWGMIARGSPVPMRRSGQGQGDPLLSHVSEEWRSQVGTTFGGFTEWVKNYYKTYYKIDLDKFNTGPQPEPQKCCLGGPDNYAGDWVWYSHFTGLACHKNLFEDLIND